MVWTMTALESLLRQPTKGTAPGWWGRISAEVARRVELARQPQPSGVRGPPLRRLLGEIGPPNLFHDLPPHRALRPQTVMLLPGFGAHPLRMRRMARALAQSGHDPHDWGLGFNLGPTAENFDFLLARVSALADRRGEPVALVGWSLGGLFAREIARRRSAEVGLVVTMGTPFSGDRRANNAWRAYQLITGHAVDCPPIAGDFTIKPPVPTVALWSPRDGVVAPRAARGRPGERDRAVALRCSHLGFATDPCCITEVLRQLDLAE